MRWGIMTVIIFFIDQFSKWLAVYFLTPYNEVPIFPGLNLKLAFNSGAAFGIFADSSGWQQIFFIVLAICISIAIVIWIAKLDKLRKLDQQNKKINLEIFALTAILAGAIGNLVDRICIGQVIDFIDVYYQNWHWYTFNVADIAISVGALLLILVTLKKT